ncbi:hypothetical protein [Modestobacter sp. NPDC049651]|uniref:hypothetical protein n=1 Tax=unclassified Modestobacter TaxID=2643866 RepID=UPI003407F329
MLGDLLLWPAVAVLGFLVLSGLVVVLATSSTARYEFERNRVQGQQAVKAPAPVAVPATDAAPATEPAAAAAPAATAPAAEAGAGRPETQPAGAVALATLPVAVPETGPSTAPIVMPGSGAHPAGRRMGESGTPAEWWLVGTAADRPGAGIVAGPFPDRVAAEWAALGCRAEVEVVHGVRGDGGRVVRRQSPAERAWLVQLGEQLDRLPDDWDDRLDDDDDALVTLVVEVAAALVEAGLQLHDCAGDAGVGGVCLTPEPGRGGVLVSWHQHDRMSREQARGAEVVAAVQEVMQDSVADCLEELGFVVEGFGASGASLVTAARRQG